MDSPQVVAGLLSAVHLRTITSKLFQDLVSIKDDKQIREYVPFQRAAGIPLTFHSLFAQHRYYSLKMIHSVFDHCRLPAVRARKCCTD